MPTSIFHRATSILLTVALLMPVPTTAFAATPLTRAEYEACQARDETAFRGALEALILRSLQSALARVDYQAVVQDAWRQERFGEFIDKRVDLAVEDLKSSTSWVERWSTLTSSAKAQELAVQATERVYRSDAMKSGLEVLAASIGREVGRPMEFATIDASDQTTACLEAFLGPRFGSAVAEVVGRNAKREYDVNSGGAAPNGGAIALEGKEAIAGAVVLLVRRQLSRMASRVGQRLVGAVLGRIVSVVAGGIGVVLIAKDIWDFRHGVLPIIAEEMKSEATKAKVRQELATSISEQIGDHTREIASSTADRVLDIWREFRRGHAKVLDLAEKNADFRRFLDALKPEDLTRVDEVAALLLGSEGETGLLRRLEDGSLQRAVTELPELAMQIARETRSIEQAIGWHAVAGSDLEKVVRLGLYARAEPRSFSRSTLSRILALDDKLAILRLASISRDARDNLFELDARNLTSLARGLEEAELETLSRYLTGLEPPAKAQFLRAVADSPVKMRILASERVRDAVLASSDQLAAVRMMMEPNSGFQPTLLRDHLMLVYEQKVSPILLWDKHPFAIVAAGFLALMLLLMLRRLFFGGRPARRAHDA